MVLLLLLLLMMMVMAIVVMIISRSGRRRGRFRRRHCTARGKRKAFLVFFCRHHHSRQQCIVHFPVHHLQLSPPPPPPQLPRGSFLQLKAEITKLVHIEGPYTQRPFFSSIHVGSRCSPLLLLLLLLVSCADPNTERVEHCAKRERRLGAGTGSQQIVVGCWLLLLLLQGAHSSAAVMAHRIRPAI